MNREEVNKALEELSKEDPGYGDILKDLLVVNEEVKGYFYERFEECETKEDIKKIIIG